MELIKNRKTIVERRLIFCMIKSAHWFRFHTGTASILGIIIF